MKPVLSNLPIIFWAKLNGVGVRLALSPIKCLTFFLVAPIVALVVSVAPETKRSICKNFYSKLDLSWMGMQIPSSQLNSVSLQDVRTRLRVFLPSLHVVER